ncbi:4-hydroxy-tetrahydrodipicolinate reductase [Spirochaetia bacterium]|nr:4-hydroxy-tetrahydrodipicolinate reductase [Spirochaetia bacterium]
MNIAIIGFGKMGRLIEAMALEKKHKIVSVVDPYAIDLLSNSGRTIFRTLKDAAQHDTAQGPNQNALEEGLNNADIAIEFTRPETAVENIKGLAALHIPMVIGTTGWYNRLPEITQVVNDAGVPLVWSSNYSIGVNLFFRIAAYAARLMDGFDEYDVGALESHHNKKIDSPSGTAKILLEHVLGQMTRKENAVYGDTETPLNGKDIHCASLRVGAMPGIHSLFFDSPADTIEITHTARNREGLAAGAIHAAEWLLAEKRSGVFTIDDVLAGLTAG